jgi:hypothetical protein
VTAIRAARQTVMLGMPMFVPGLQPAREFYVEAMHPLLAEHFPQVRYAAGLLGPGSEVTVLHTERFTDHDWGPRL